MTSLHQISSGYSVLKPEPTTLKQASFFVLISPVLLVRWVCSFAIGQLVTYLALNPLNIRRQRPVHRLTEDDTEVIVNLVPHQRFKLLSDSLLKIRHRFAWIPFLALPIEQLQSNRARDMAHVEQVVDRIVALRAGQSRYKHCENTRFEWNNIHLKGLEYLDTALQEYFWARLAEKTYGQVTSKTPRRSLFEFFTLKLADGAVLDSVATLGPKEHTKSMRERRFIIKCMAHGKNYVTHLLEHRDTAETINCTVVAFNYRGVDYSRGLVWTQHNMVDDAVAEAKRLISLGAKPEHVLLDGHCLGGIVATLAAAKLSQLGYAVKLTNDRTFVSLPRFLAGYCLPDQENRDFRPITLLRYVMSGLIYVTMSILLTLSDWEMDAVTAWNRIDKKDKYYFIAQEQCNGAWVSHDGIVHSWASMAAINRGADTPEHVFVPKHYVTDSAMPIHWGGKAAKNRTAHVSSREDLVSKTNHNQSARDFFHTRQAALLGLTLPSKAAVLPGYPQLLLKNAPEWSADDFVPVRSNYPFGTAG